MERNSFGGGERERERDRSSLFTLMYYHKRCSFADFTIVPVSISRDSRAIVSACDELNAGRARFADK